MTAEDVVQQRSQRKKWRQFSELHAIIFQLKTNMCIRQVAWKSPISRLTDRCKHCLNYVAPYMWLMEFTVGPFQSSRLSQIDYNQDYTFLWWNNSFATIPIKEIFSTPLVRQSVSHKKSVRLCVTRHPRRPHIEPTISSSSSSIAG